MACPIAQWIMAQGLQFSDPPAFKPDDTQVVELLSRLDDLDEKHQVSSYLTRAASLLKQFTQQHQSDSPETPATTLRKSIAAIWHFPAHLLPSYKKVVSFLVLFRFFFPKETDLWGKALLHLPPGLFCDSTPSAPLSQSSSSSSTPQHADPSPLPKLLDLEALEGVSDSTPCSPDDFRKLKAELQQTQDTLAELVRLGSQGVDPLDPYHVDRVVASAHSAVRFRELTQKLVYSLRDKGDESSAQTAKYMLKVVDRIRRVLTSGEDADEDVLMGAAYREVLAFVIANLRYNDFRSHRARAEHWKHELLQDLPTRSSDDFTDAGLKETYERIRRTAPLIQQFHQTYHQAGFASHSSSPPSQTIIQSEQKAHGFKPTYRHFSRGGRGPRLPT